MAVQDKVYSTHEFDEFINQPENADKRFELDEGIIHELAASSATPSIIAAEITAFFRAYVRQHKNGYVTSADGGFEQSPKNVLMPDVGFISKARQPNRPTRYFKIAPDLAVEVVSPTDSIRAVQRKARKYIAYGTRLVWVIYPDDKTAEIYRPAEGGILVQEINIEGILDGGEILPGFMLAMKDIFAVLEE
jgi:Uma2 family endonuclease